MIMDLPWRSGTSWVQQKKRQARLRQRDQTADRAGNGQTPKIATLRQAFLVQRMGKRYADLMGSPSPVSTKGKTPESCENEMTSFTLLDQKD